MSKERRPSPAEIYQQYFVPAIHARWTPLFLQYADPKPGEEVLDVACGTGIVAHEAAQRISSEGMVVGLDPQPEMLELAHGLAPSNGTDIKWLEGKASSLPDGDFDLITCQQGLQFFPDKSAAASEMNRVLIDEGRAVPSIWKDLDHHPLYRAMCEAEARYLDTSVESVATPFSYGDENELRSLMTNAGFSQVEIVTESKMASFAMPDRFIALTLFGAAALVPAFQEMDEMERSKMVRQVRREIEGTLQEHLDNDSVRFPMHANIALGRV